MLFQAMLLHSIRGETGSTTVQEMPRPLLPRRSEQVAQYKSFTLSGTPLGLAFRKGSREASTTCAALVAESEPQKEQTSLSGKSAPHTSARQKQSQLGLFFRSAASSSGAAAGAAVFWTLQLRLRNPHSLCYLNAGVLSLVHFVEVAGLNAYAALVQVCRGAQQGGRELCLSQQLVVRSLFQGWRFSNVQRDCAELLSQAVTQQRSLWSEWEHRSVMQAVQDTGTCPILLPTPIEPELSLQALVDRWCYDDGCRVLTAQQPLMLQLGRSTEQGKNQSCVLFEGLVSFRVKCGANVEPRTFRVVSGVLRLGDRITSGHFHPCQG